MCLSNMSDPAPWSHRLLELDSNRELLELIRGERDGFVEVGSICFGFLG